MMPTITRDDWTRLTIKLSDGSMVVRDFPSREEAATRDRTADLFEGLKGRMPIMLKSESGNSPGDPVTPILILSPEHIVYVRFRRYKGTDIHTNYVHIDPGDE